MSANSNTLGGAVPIFPVASVAASIEYYVNRLGFKLNWEVPEVFAEVARDRSTIFSMPGGPGTSGHLGVDWSE